MGPVVTHLINGFEADQAQRRADLADELAAIAADSRTSPDPLLAIGQTRAYDCIEDPVDAAPGGRPPAGGGAAPQRPPR